LNITTRRHNAPNGTPRIHAADGHRYGSA